MLAGLVVFVSISCGAPEPEAPIAEPHASSRPTFSEQYENAIPAARSWLDQLEVDPVALVASSEKGKKKLGEALTAYLYLRRHEVDPDERGRLSDRIDELAQHTRRPEYHNMLRCDIREFNQNSMSYFRVAWVLEQLGWDTTEYRTQLESIRPRLDESLVRRSAAAREQFRRYYEYFGLPLPSPAASSDEKPSTLTRRLPVKKYQLASSYALAHEVSVAYRFGSNRSSGVFSTEDLDYLRRVLPRLVMRFTSRRHANPDLVAELLSAMAYLDLRSLPAYRTGIQFLLRSQNPNGTWGSYEAKRASLGDGVDTKLYLHTTMVALRALLQSKEPGRPKPPGAAR
jgi:hypothetical protein